MRFPWTRPKARNNSSVVGHTLENAYVLHATGTAQGIAHEFMFLERLFGKQNLDWRLHERSLIQTPDRRIIEKFIVGTSKGRREIFIDISSWYGSPSDPASHQIFEDVVARQQRRILALDLPRKPLLMLCNVITNLPDDQLPPQIDRDAVLAALMQSSIQAGFLSDDNWADQPTPVALTFSVADWIHIYSLLGMIKASDLLGEELIEDLRAYIGGALKEIGPE